MDVWGYGFIRIFVLLKLLNMEEKKLYTYVILNDGQSNVIF